MRNLIRVGLGSFTTFSTFGCETRARLRDKKQPAILTMADTTENTRSSLDIVDGVIAEDIATLDDVDIHFYRGVQQSSSRGGRTGT